MRTQKIHNQDGKFYGWMIKCPGCDIHHVLDQRWTFNENFSLPTFKASLLVKWDMEQHGLPNKICHSFITDGKIRYLDDCTHHLKGQTVDLPELEEHE